MKNREVARLLNEIADILSLGDESVFRIRAYQRAAQAVEALPGSIEEIAKKGKLRDIPGVGESVAGKIREYLATGKMAALEKLRKDYPSGLLDMMTVAGMGPKKAKLLYDRLHIAGIAELAAAAQEGKIRDLPGFGVKTEENILKGIAFREKSRERILLNEAHVVAREIIDELSKNDYVRQISTAGSLKRFKETIGDIDILCAVDSGKERQAVEQFTSLPQVRRVLAKGDTKGSVITESGRQIDLRVIKPEVYGAALQYFTGSKEHNVALRTYARQRGYTISEYGVFRLGHKRKPLVALREEDVYGILRMQYIPPPLRENRGEIEAALKRKIPKLVERKDIKGDVHVHSRYSDGANSIKQLAAAARERGYEWLIVTDHSPSLKVARGLSVETLRRKIDEIRALNRTLRGIKVLCGTEVDILNDGSIDYPDSMLERLDFVIASVHGGFKQSEERMTRRIIRALEHPHVSCLGHPTGRLLNRREPYAVNMEAVLTAAKKHGKLIEINVFPDRLDLYDIYCKRAKEMGIKLAIGTDSHSTGHLDYMDTGVMWAQRGWLEKRDVINTCSYNDLMKFLRKEPAAAV